MADERTYIIPLRKEWLKVPKYQRAKKAVTGVKKFLMRHMKQDDPKKIKLGEYLNKELWKRGIKNPPHKVKITVTKDDEGIVKAELFGRKYVAKVKPEKVEKATGLKGKLQSALEKPKKEEAEEEKPKEEKKEAKPAPVKKEEKAKEEKKETKKPEPKPAEKKAEPRKEEKKPAEKKKEAKAPEKKPAKKEHKPSPKR